MVLLVDQNVLDVVGSPPASDVRVDVFERTAFGVGRLPDRVLVEGQGVRPGRGVAPAGVIVGPLHRAQLLLDGELLAGLEHEDTQPGSRENVGGHAAGGTGAHDHRVVGLGQVDILLEGWGNSHQGHRGSPLSPAVLCFGSQTATPTRESAVP